MKRNTLCWGQGGEMNQALYAHMNNKTIKKKAKLLKTKQNEKAPNFIMSKLQKMLNWFKISLVYLVPTSPLGCQNSMWPGH
jgi:hypothetical protein